MKKQIAVPIIVAEGQNIEFFKDIDYMLSYLEANDVKNGAYQVYDSDGQELDLIVEEVVQKLFGGLVKIEKERLTLQVKDSDNIKIQADELKGKLINSLMSLRKQTNENDLKSMSLKQLIEIFVEIVGYVR